MRGGVLRCLAFVLGALGLVSIAGAQQKTPSKELEFEVASIRPSLWSSPDKGYPFVVPGSNLRPTSGLFSLNAPFMAYVNFAYDLISVQEWRPADGSLPKWVKESQWDIEARAEGVPTRAETQQMMRSLLKTRFKLALHFENRKQEVYALKLVKSGKFGPGLKLHTSQSSCHDGLGTEQMNDKEQLYCGGQYWNDHGRGRRAISDVSMAELAAYLGPNMGLDRALVDQTGLSGRYDVDFAYVQGDPPQGETWMDYIGDKYRDEVQEQLGLKIVPATAQLPVLVLDHIEKPTPN
jgi:uncharacterized protein (TIGR03435 family)